VLYGGTFFFANFGPNATTFLLPSMTFTHTCRSTLNGVSAASGKLGAFLGAILFEPVSHASGNDSVMLICSGIAMVGWLFTVVGVEANVGRGGEGGEDGEGEDDEDDDNGPLIKARPSAVG
jgi:PHS family inorganic phosphate transporter-like MFS transporter